MDNNLKKKGNESFEEYCHRISELKDSINATWDHVASIINDQCGCDYTADKYRKSFKRYQNSLTDGVEKLETKKEYREKEGSIEKEEKEYNYVPFDKETITVDYVKNETVSSKEIPLTSSQLNNPAELLRAHGYNPDEFELKTASNTKTTRKTLDGTTSVYSSRITIKPKKSLVSEMEEIKNLFEHFKSQKITRNYTPLLSDEYLLVPLYDLHFGRLPDTENFERYDINEEKERIINHIRKYVDKFYGRKFKKVYLIIGQDFLNSSFTGYTSSQSHLQSNAIDFRTMFKAGAELLISIIDMFAEASNQLEVIGSLGNHDIAEEVALFSLIKAYYRTVDYVKVDDGTAPRKYLEIGNACVGLGHLDKENKRAFGVMQVEAKDIWARTKTHIFVAGHLHHFSVSSENGVELYRVPSICAHDRWTTESGYVMNEPKTMCFVFDEANGLIETHFMYL